MTIFEMQEEPHPLDNFDCYIREARQQYDEGRSSYNNFHHSLVTWYGAKKDGFLTRYHASLIEDYTENKGSRYISLARILVYEKDIDGAIALYRKALENDPECSVSHEEVGYCLAEQKKYEEAIYHYDEALKEQDDMDWVWDAKGNALANLGRYAEVLECFQLALKHDTDESRHYIYHYMIGMSHHQLGDHYRAMAHYTQALQLRPNFPEALHNIGALHYTDDDALYDVKQAIEYFKQAEAVAEAEDINELKTLAYINLSRIYYAIGEFDLHEHYKSKLFEHMGIGDFMEMYSGEGKEYLLDDEDTDDDEDMNDDTDEGADETTDPDDPLDK